MNPRHSSNTLLQKYLALPPYEQSVLQLLSLLYEGCTVPTLYSLIMQLKVFLPQKTPASYPHLLGVLRNLRKYHLIDVGNRCRVEIAEEVMRRAAADGRLGQMAAVVLESWKRQQYHPGTYIRDLRMAIYLGSAELFRYRYRQLEATMPSSLLSQRFSAICDNPFRPEWFIALPPVIQACAMKELLGAQIQELGPLREEFRQILEKQKRASIDDGGDLFRDQLATLALLTGDLTRAKEIARWDEARNSLLRQIIWGACVFLEGDTAQALEIFERTPCASSPPRHGGKNPFGAWQVQRKGRGYVDHFAVLFYPLALLHRNRGNDLATAQDFYAHYKRPDSSSAWSTLFGFTLYRRNHTQQAEQCFAAAENMLGKNALSDFFAMVFYSWVNPMAINEKYLEELFIRASRHGYRWVAGECAGILSRLQPEHPPYRKYLEDNPLSTRPLFSMFKLEEGWERSLTALERLFAGEDLAESSKESRLVWFLKLDPPVLIEAKEQKRKANGDWTRGRRVPVYHITTLQCLTPEDKKIYEALVNYYQVSPLDYYRGERKSEWEKVLLSMVGHPQVYLAKSPDERVEIVKGEPALIVEPKGGKLTIRFDVDIAEKKVVVVQERENRIKVIDVSGKQPDIARLLGKGGLSVPLESKERVLKLLGAMSSELTVQSSVAGLAGNIEAIAADPKIYVRIYPWKEGLKLQLLVKPLGQNGPCFPPAVGGENIIAEIDGKKYQAQRDLEREKKEAYRVVGACPLISGPAYPRWEWEITAVEDCLQTLLDIDSLKDVPVEWPEGEKFKVPKRGRIDQLRLGIERQRDWFAVSGEIKVDEATVLELKDLLILLDSSPNRFISLGQGQFLALTEEFRRRMEELSSFGEITGKGVKVHPLAAVALRDLTSGIGSLSVCDSWDKELRDMESAQALEIAVPRTFTGELRSYQVDGFKWLCRMARWGVGACLADDMGLGKTVQALTMLIARGDGGPSLVVAPTSVCLNWEKEARRFAPTLNPRVFNGRSDEGELKALKAFDVLIVSYGLMQSRIEAFSEVSWHNIILDEAQAIKNMNTKRSKAVMSLKSDFKLITTGTPVENHLEELWNLFRFINPGLLGSLEKFRRRFAIPIQKHQDPGAQAKLKKLVQPFILRRLKSQVLQELPPRTEIALDVELTEEETVFYEALRRKAVEKLAQCDPTERQFQVLAEIMKLRRACCHPRLIHPESSIASSKIEVFGEIVSDLIENHHKALVFSQFVTYLTIIRDYLDRHGYHYQYLDGSTPQKDRERSVEAFQSGDGDLFLISLKAGGLGLNLTAADYVIHMDPWWNPAVEDQAADRTHRIGQERPVTIYRLITRNTIEEKIVQLHREKRDLASRLLEGADVTDKISAEELLKLIRDSAS